MMFTARDVRKAASLFLLLVLLVLVYIHETFKKNSILSLTLAPNLRERMEKKLSSILSLTFVPNLCERMEIFFSHPLTDIGAKSL